MIGDQWRGSLTLAYHLFRRDMQERYTGTLLGVLWLVLQPLGMLLLYTLVFGEILQVRFTGAQDTAAFAFHLFAGLLVFNALAEVLNRAPSLLVERRDLLLNTPLPAGVLPLLPVASSICLEWLALLVFAVVLLWQGHWQWVAVPWVLLGYLAWWLVRVLLSLAFAYLLAVLGVFLRDLRQLMPATLTVLLFITPVFYPPERLPDTFRPLQDWNILAQVVQGYRDVLLGDTFAWGHYWVVLSISLGLCLLALWLFRQLLPKARYVL